MAKNISSIIDHNLYYINQADIDIMHLKLGKSTKTIKSSGCLICSVAMLVMYYLKDNEKNTKIELIEQMTKDCNEFGDYKNSGIKIKNRNFKVDNNLKDMYARLETGEPSICQLPGHFIVINGYYDNDYLVLDPGKRINTKLGQVKAIRGDIIKSKRFVYEY